MAFFQQSESRLRSWAGSELGLAVQAAAAWEEGREVYGGSCTKGVTYSRSCVKKHSSAAGGVGIERAASVAVFAKTE